MSREVTTDHMEVLADRFEVQVHMFDMNGIQPEFTYHSPKRNYADHIFILQDMTHFHFISNFKGLLRNFRRSDCADFCEDCFGIKFGNRNHTCIDEEAPIRYCVGNRKLAYFPDTGEDDFKITKCILHTPEKPEITNKIIYLDFETFVHGEKCITAESEPFI